MKKIEMGTVIIMRHIGFFMATGLILTLLSLPAFPETNDGDFNVCLKILRQSQFKLADEPWHVSRLPNDIDKIEQPDLGGDLIVRWTDHKNQDGSMTYVIHTRDPDRDQLAFNPDDFDVVLKQGNIVLFKNSIATNAFAFSATQRHGVNGLLFCEYGELSPLWNWTGSDWNP